jgi:hypothetical protein
MSEAHSIIEVSITQIQYNEYPEMALGDLQPEKECISIQNIKKVKS